MSDRGDRVGRGRGRNSHNSSNNGYQTPTSGRIGGRYSGTPSSANSDRPRGGRHSGGSSRGGRGRSPYSSGNPSARLPGGGGSTGSRAAFDRGRIFSGGQHAVRYEKEKRLWKVGPPHGDQHHRFQLAAFLKGLTEFIEHQLEQRALGQGLGNVNRNNNNSTRTRMSTAINAAATTAAGEEEDVDKDESIDTTASLGGEFAVLALKKDSEDDDEEVGEENEEKEKDVKEGELSSTSSPICPEVSSSTSRTWWTSSSLGNDSLIDAASLPRNAVATKEEEEAAAAAFAASYQQRQRSQAGPLELSLRLERLDLTDVEASMLADWAEKHAKNNTASIKKLWLFGNRLSDDGAAAVARIIALGTVNECHLSHNLITLVGAQKLLETVPVGEELSEEEDVTRVENSTITQKRLINTDLSNPLWLRLEWNRISLSGLVNVLEAQHAQRGLLCDVPEAAREDAAPPLPTLPNYLLSAKEKNKNSGDIDKGVQNISTEEEESEEKNATAAPSSSSQYHQGETKNNFGSSSHTSAFTRSTRNQLNYIIEQCHCRLPWVSSQFETPSEAAVLLNAKTLWGSKLKKDVGAGVAADAVAAALVESNTFSKHDSNTTGKMSNTPIPSSLPSKEAPGRSSSLPVLSPSPSSPSSSSGPLLLIPDTSALLAMAGADPSMTTPTFFTLEWLLKLSTQGLFGRTIPDPLEHIFIIVPASVATQLDALKADPGARSAVRRFMSKGLDDMGPAGANFLTMLGAHEGEGLVLEHGAEVAGSRGADVGSRGQATDHRIVEVGLYFQQECVKAASDAVDYSIGSTGIHENSESMFENRKESSLTSQDFFSALPVILLTSDNGQQALAKAHGLPAVRMADLDSHAVKMRILSCLEGEGEGAGQRQPLTASVLRAALRPAAVAALGKVAARSLQMEFDGAVACLRAAVEHLKLAQSRELALREELQGGDESAELNSELEATGTLIEALEKRLKEWDGLIRSHQVASRVLQWSTLT